MGTQQARERAEAARVQTRAAKARFDAAHRKGMEALKTGDTKALEESIQEEREALSQIPIPRLE